MNENAIAWLSELDIIHGDTVALAAHLTQVPLEALQHPDYHFALGYLAGRQERDYTATRRIRLRQKNN